MAGDRNSGDPHFPQAAIDRIAAPLRRFTAAESATGLALLFTTLIAIVVANTSLGPAFSSFWEARTVLRVGPLDWNYPLRYWINHGLMTIFFFIVGLEIKREIVHGELSEAGAAILPVTAATGGMLVPAGLYLVIASGPQAMSGWGIVMATDIAFVVGGMSLLGRRIPDSLRVFILALAIIDDIGATLVIAIGYGSGFHLLPFAAAALGFGLTLLLQWIGVRHVPLYWLVGMATWVAMHESGIHPTLAGVGLGLLTPVRPWVDPTRLDRFLAWARSAGTRLSAGMSRADNGPRDVRRRLARAAVESLSPQQRLEGELHVWSAFVILPLFALANAGVPISLANAVDPIAIAVMIGLLIGKPLGIFTFSWLSVKFGIARKPDDVPWPLLLAASMLAGIGFTMSLFIGNLAFDDQLLRSAKISILAASVLAGSIGMFLVWMFAGGERKDT